MIAPWSMVRQRTRCEATRFADALTRPRESQHEQLRRILEHNADSAFGRRHGFRDLHDADAFRARVQRHRYEDLARDIHACCEDGVENQLTCEPVVHCELTSGTTTDGRLIPYTASMLAAFQAPVIMMSQNRQAARDRADQAHDYEINLKTEMELMQLHDKVDEFVHDQLVTMLEQQNHQIEMLRELLLRLSDVPPPDNAGDA